MAKRVLMIAFHYPPCGASSGLQRTLAFTRYLSSHGWEPALVSVTPTAYEATSNAQLGAIPEGMPVWRTRAYDAARHFSVAGRYPSFLAVPDRWANWQYFAVRAAMKMVKEFEPDLIWSTFPIATAHQIAAKLVAKTGLPWVADMRDPMVEFEPISGVWYPMDKAIRRARLRIEKSVTERAAKVVFCTEGAREICAERYGQRSARKFSVVPNGYDEATFANLITDNSNVPKQKSDEFVMVHSGTVYPGSDRGPDDLFRALKDLKNASLLPSNFRLVMRASGHDSYIAALIDDLGVAALVQLAPPIPYQAALSEMLQADALLVLQGHSSNPAIPAKVYEYLRSRRPILALVHPQGETAKLLGALNAATCAPLDNFELIRASLEQLFTSIKNNRVHQLSDHEIRRFSRESQTEQLAGIFDQAIHASGDI